MGTWFFGLQRNNSLANESSATAVSGSSIPAYNPSGTNNLTTGKVFYYQIEFSIIDFNQDVSAFNLALGMTIQSSRLPERSTTFTVSSSPSSGSPAVGGSCSYEIINSTSTSSTVKFVAEINDGYEFEGWYLKDNSTSESDKVSSDLVFITTITGNANYYAKWKEIPPGSGTESDPYIIYSVATFNKYANDTYFGTSGLYFKLTKTIETSEVLTQSDFAGTFTSAENCYIKLNNSSSQTLFNNVTGTINGLVIERVDGSGPAIASSLTNGTLENIVVKGKSTGYGIVSSMTGSGTLKKCLNYSTVDSTNSASGIVGSYSGTGGIITQCVNYGNVTGEKKSVAGILRGIYSSINPNSASSLTISECVNYGNIFVREYNDSSGTAVGGFAGGIVGEFDSTYNTTLTIQSCYNTGSISGGWGTLSDSAAGGIIGYVDKYNKASLTLNNNMCISSSITGGYNKGMIVGGSYAYTSGSTTADSSFISYSSQNIYRSIGLKGNGIESDGSYIIGADFSQFSNSSWLAKRGWTFGTYGSATSGWVFVGAKITIDGVVQELTLPRLAFEDLELTDVVTYNVSVEKYSDSPDGGCSYSVSPSTITSAGAEVTFTANVSSGYQFWGWYDAQSGGNRLSTNATYTTTLNYKTTLYAYWVPVVTYKVGTYSSEYPFFNGERTIAENFEYYNPMGSNILIAGWFMDADLKQPCSDEYINQKTLTGPITIYTKLASTTGLTYTLNNGSYYVSDNGASGDVVIPYKYKSLPVLGISAGTATAPSFNKNTNITSVVFPSSFTSIAEYSFTGCTALTGVTLTNKITSIGDYAFSKCSGIKAVSLGNVQTIGQYAFERVGITSLKIPSSATTIDMHAFSYCESLETLVLGSLTASGVITLEAYSFEYCTKLSKVTILQTIQDLGMSGAQTSLANAKVFINQTVNLSVYQSPFAMMPSTVKIYTNANSSSLPSSWVTGKWNICSSKTLLTVNYGYTQERFDAL